MRPPVHVSFCTGYATCNVVFPSHEICDLFHETSLPSTICISYPYAFPTHMVHPKFQAGERRRRGAEGGREKCARLNTQIPPCVGVSAPAKGASLSSQRKQPEPSY